MPASAAAVRRWTAAAMLATVGLAAVAGTGFGAGPLSTTKNVQVNVLASISLTDPVALDAGSDAGTTWTPGSADVLNLGELQPTDQAKAAATWRVTTSNPTGYAVTVTNAGPAPMMRSAGGSMADMPAAPAPLDLTKTHFGVAAGDAAGHAQTSTSYTGSPWGSTGASGTQGTLYAGIPSGGSLQVAGSSAGADSDPFTLNFAAITAASQPLASGAYTGTARITAYTTP